MAERPQFRVQGSTELAKGDRQALADEIALAESFGDPGSDLPAPDEPDLGTGVDFGPFYGEEDPEGYDEALFAPTDRPDIPLTEGMPFGAGHNFTVGPKMEQRDHMNAIARRMLELAHQMPDDALRWASRQMLES